MEQAGCFVLDLQLPECGVPADVDQVPLVLDRVEGAFVYPADLTKRRDIVHQFVHIISEG